MNTTKSYHSSNFLHSSGICKSKAIFFLLLFFTVFTIQARDNYKEIPLEPIKSFDEVPVEIIVKGYLKFEADIIITDRNTVYVNVAELFRKLGIYCVTENDGNILKGFIVNENSPYIIDFDSKLITRGENSVKTVNGIVKELGAIYVETSIINEVFGLNMVFNFRALSIMLEADFELPMVKQARLETIRKNISKLQKNEIVVDTVIGRKYHLFNGGVMDWSLSSTQVEGTKVNNIFSLGLGSELLYGEAKVAFNYYDQTKFDRRQLYYNWRWIDNDNPYVKQVQIGKIGTQSIAFINAPVVGASFNNSPNTVRKAKGTYTINEYTEPNWTVELYINDALVEFTQADASGLYVFNVPIVYGYTTLKLRFYGPLGEEKIEEKTINTPYTFMPTNVLEYQVSAGMLEDGNSNKMGRGEFNYGLNRLVTLGGGLEYLSSIADKPLIPFVNLAFQPFSKMVVNMEYAHDVNFKGLLNYYFGKGAFLELDYNKFVEGQQVMINRTNEERKLSLTLPYKISSINGTAKLSLNQFVYDSFNFNQMDAVFSGRYRNYSANASLASNWITGESPFMTSTLALSRRLHNGLTLRPTLQYNITNRNLMRVRAEVEKRVSKMSYTVFYERNIEFATDNVFLNFRYDLSFARTGFATSYNNKQISVSESAQGSIAFGADNGVIKTGNNSALGRGGLLLYPFIDLNQNGKWDKGEQKVLLSKVKVTGGKAIISEKDSIVRVSDLNAFINYNVEFSDADLDNISWRFKHKNYQILVDPNQYKKVYVPIHVIGEVNGTVFIKREEEVKGQGRITVQIFDKQGTKVAETLSETDGYYSYLGLKPGEYTIRIDESQLSKLGYQSFPKTQNTIIKVAEDGTLVEGLNFTISESEVKINEPIAPEVSIKTFPVVNPKIFSPKKREAKKSSKTKTETEKVPQNKLKSGNGSLDILNRYSKETNGKMYGSVRSKLANSSIGVSGIVVQLYDKEGVKISEVITNDKGDFNFSELIPREYIIQLDNSQLDQLEYQSKNKSLTAVILTAVEGDIINNLNFEIESTKQTIRDSKTSKNILNNKPIQDSIGAGTETIEEKNESTTVLDKKQVLETKINKSFSKISETQGAFYSIQIGVFKNIVSPKQLLNLSPVYYEILDEESTRYLSGKYDLLKTAKAARNKIILSGIKDAYVVAYQDGNKMDRISLDNLKKNTATNVVNIHGQVQLKEENTAQDVGGLKVQIWNTKGVKISEVFTDNKGFFSVKGLQPGKYIVSLDEEELVKLGCNSIPISHNVDVSRSLEGNKIQKLDFVLAKIKK